MQCSIFSHLRKYTIEIIFFNFILFEIIKIISECQLHILLFHISFSLSDFELYEIMPLFSTEILAAGHSLAHHWSSVGTLEYTATSIYVYLI